MTPSEESMTLMTSYRFPHHGNRSSSLALRMTSYRLPHYDSSPSHSLWMTSYGFLHHSSKSSTSLRVKLIVSRHSERWQECLVRKTGSGNMTPSEESITRMTFNVSLTTTANPLLMFRMTPNGNHMLRLLTHS